MSIRRWISAGQKWGRRSGRALFKVNRVPGAGVVRPECDSYYCLLYFAPSSRQVKSFKLRPLSHFFFFLHPLLFSPATTILYLSDPSRLRVKNKQTKVRRRWTCILYPLINSTPFFFVRYVILFVLFFLLLSENVVLFSLTISRLKQNKTGDEIDTTFNLRALSISY